MAERVLIPQDVAEEGKIFLRERGYEVKMGSGITEDVIAREVVGCSAILARTATFSRKILEAEKGLKVIGRNGVGVDNIDVQAADELGIWVTNAPESNAATVAEHTMGLIIACARNFGRCEREFRAGNFEVRNQVKGIDLEGKTLGLLGLGRIGGRVARMASAGFDMKVIGYDPFLPAERFPAEAVKVEDWDTLFAEADFVSLHLPSSPETKGSVGAGEFDLMKSSAYLINAARGEIVDEPELIRALQANKIAGCGLDVFMQEPPPVDNPLLSMDNVKLTPHNAALTAEAMMRMSMHAAQGIDEVLSGRRPTWPVNNPRNPR